MALEFIRLQTNLSQGPAGRPGADGTSSVVNLVSGSVNSYGSVESGTFSINSSSTFLLETGSLLQFQSGSLMSGSIVPRVDKVFNLGAPGAAFSSSWFEVIWMVSASDSTSLVKSQLDNLVRAISSASYVTADSLYVSSSLTASSATGTFYGAHRGDGTQLILSNTTASWLRNIRIDSASFAAKTDQYIARYSLAEDAIVLSEENSPSFTTLPGIPSGLLSGSAQIASEISGAFTEVSSGFATQISNIDAFPYTGTAIIQGDMFITQSRHRKGIELTWPSYSYGANSASFALTASANYPILDIGVASNPSAPGAGIINLKSNDKVMISMRSGTAIEMKETTIFTGNSLVDQSTNGAYLTKGLIASSFITLNGPTQINDTLDINETTTARDILPESNRTHDLGSPILEWEDVYSRYMHTTVSYVAFISGTANTYLDLNPDKNIYVYTPEGRTIFNQLVSVVSGVLPEAGNYSFVGTSGSSFAELNTNELQISQSNSKRGIFLSTGDYTNGTHSGSIYMTTSSNTLGTAFILDSNCNGPLKGTLQLSTNATAGISIYNGDVTIHRTGSHYGPSTFASRVTLNSVVQGFGSATMSNIVPNGDDTYHLGRADVRWSEVHARNVYAGGLNEYNFEADSVYPAGTVLSWNTSSDFLEPCEFGEIPLGISNGNNTYPTIYGVEHVLITGSWEPFQYVIAGPTGWGYAVDRSVWISTYQGKSIGLTLDDGSNGKSKTLINRQ